MLNDKIINPGLHELQDFSMAKGKRLNVTDQVETKKFPKFHTLVDKYENSNRTMISKLINVTHSSEASLICPYLQASTESLDKIVISEPVFDMIVPSPKDKSVNCLENPDITKELVNEANYVFKSLKFDQVNNWSITFFIQC